MRLSEKKLKKMLLKISEEIGNTELLGILREKGFDPSKVALVISQGPESLIIIQKFFEEILSTESMKVIRFFKNQSYTPELAYHLATILNTIYLFKNTKSIPFIIDFIQNGLCQRARMNHSRSIRFFVESGKTEKGLIDYIQGY